MKWYRVMYMGCGDRLEMVTIKADTIAEAIAKVGVILDRVINVYPY